MIINIFLNRSGERLLQYENRLPSQNTLPTVEINYAEVGGKKATPYIFQSKDLSIVLFLTNKDTGE